MTHSLIACRPVPVPIQKVNKAKYLIEKVETPHLRLVQIRKTVPHASDLPHRGAEWSMCLRRRHAHKLVSHLGVRNRQSCVIPSRQQAKPA